MTLRERQRLQTRTAIHSAAVSLVLERGVATVTVQDISDAADVSPRTFFNHFRSKEDALVPEFAGFDRAAEETFLRGDEPDLLDALATLIAQHIQAKVDARGWDFRRQLHLVADNPCLAPRLMLVFDALRQHLGDLIAQRTGRDSDDQFCRVAAAVTVGTARVAVQDWAGRQDQDATFDAAVIREGFANLRLLTKGTL